MVTAVVEPTGSTIEALFRPSTRFRDSHRNRRGGCLPGGWTEVELLQDLTLEDVLATGISWEEFCLFLRNKVVWMTPDVYIRSGYMVTNADDLEVLALQAEASRCPRLRVHVRMGMAAAGVTATCDFLLRLLATCEKDSVFISGFCNAVSPALSSAGLSRFFRESQPCLRKVTLYGLVLSEDQCLALTTMPRLDVELAMARCSLSNDAAFAFVECIRSDRGPVDLYECRIDSQILANALTGKSRVTRLKPHSGGTNAVQAIFFRVLANNKSLSYLDLSNHTITDENWMILCQSLQGHPNLTSLDLMFTSPLVLNPVYTSPRAPLCIRIALSTEVRSQRTRVLAEMVQRNTSLHTIKLSADEEDQQIYAEMIHPYLETNRYRPRVLAITKAAIPLRRPLLGLALQTRSVRSNSNFLWMFLSANPDVVVISNEDDEQVTEAAAS
jgi:hypothetical protein